MLKLPFIRIGFVCGLVVTGLGGIAQAAMQSGSVGLGKVSFTAETNVKMFKFTGNATDLHSKFQRDGESLSSFELSIPVAALKTGMDIRDRHMQERVFTTDSGSMPDIVFKSSQSTCGAGDSKTERKCEIQGFLTIRGQEKPYLLSLVIKDGNQAMGHAVIDVTQFGVTDKALSYEGIKVNPKVVLDFQVTVI